jgi:AraC-like DNA-binding protein
VSAHYHYLPHPKLAAFIDGFCLTENDDPSPVSTGERYLPAGKMELNILLGGGTIREYDRHHHRPDLFEDFHSGELSGVNSKFATGDTANLVSLIKVLFKPYGAHPLLPFPISEVFNQPVSLDTLWGAAANDLCEQLQTAKTPQRKFRLLEQFLLARLDEERSPHPAVLYAVKEFQAAHGQGPVSEVTERLGLRPKRFIRLFREAVGLTPKLFCRIRRFQQLLYLIERQEHPVEWAEMATMSGYFDQAHLIHDFQTFSGFTPEAYLKQKREQNDVTRSEEACRKVLNNAPQEHVHGLNAYGYPEVCRRSINTELPPSPTNLSHIPLLD